MGYDFMLLGSGELGREFVIAAKRMGYTVVAVDRYDNAPAMQLADCSETINMMNGSELERVVTTHKPKWIVPEIEAINIDKLVELEQTYTVIPCANAVKVCMDRKALRLLATRLEMKTAQYQFADSNETLQRACDEIGFPCVVKPLMSSSGKGQTVVRSKDDIDTAWDNLSKSRGTSNEAIVEEFIDIDKEITLLTVSTKHSEDTEILFCQPIGHTQSDGDYQESWQPADVSLSKLHEFGEISQMAESIVNNLGGVGVWGAEFFISTDGEVYFSEISPRPHDTGMVTLANTQHLNQFELHLYAILGLEIVNNYGIIPTISKGASRALCYRNDDILVGNTNSYTITGISEALESSTVPTKIYLFNKPFVYNGRRVGVILSNSDFDQSTTKTLRDANERTLKRIKIE